MKIKTSELIGPALNWVVAKCEGLDPNTDPEVREQYVGYPGFAEYNGFGYAIKNYSTDWAQGGPIIEREIGNLWKHNKLDPNEPDVWTAAAYCKAPDGTMLYYEDGPTPLIAAMRCFVSSKLGDEVEVPDGLF